ncbi:MAG: hypothetical protein WKG01_06295 [Kofleriaceae bacterium]
MCNQPQRLKMALAPVRAALLAPPPVQRWGLGYIQGGDVLLVRTPKASTTAVDLAGPLAEIATDCAIAQAIVEDGFSGTDNTPPFRYRRWLFAQTLAGVRPSREHTAALEALAPRLVEHIPEYLRRNIKGRTPSELVFHLVLARLHDEGHIDDPNLRTATTLRALAATLKQVLGELENIHPTSVTALGNVALTNGRSMVVARREEPLRLRRLWLNNDRGEPERGPEAFRGVLLISGGDGSPHEGFEDVPAHHAVLISRDLQVTLAEVAL